VLFPEIVHEGELLATAYALPDKALREVAVAAPREPQADAPATPGTGYGPTASSEGTANP